MGIFMWMKDGKCGKKREAKYKMWKIISDSGGDI
jgi:hypothetical protein